MARHFKQTTMKTAEEYYRAKNYLVGKQLSSQDLENIAIMESYAKERAVEYKNYILRNYGWSDRELIVPDDSYDTFIKDNV